MNEVFMETIKPGQKDVTANEGKTQYEYGGYQIRIHFSGEKTLAQCVRNLTERRIAC